MKLERNGKRLTIVLEDDDETIEMRSVVRYYIHRACPVGPTPMKMLLQELQKEIIDAES